MRAIYGSKVKKRWEPNGISMMNLQKCIYTPVVFISKKIVIKDDHGAVKWLLVDDFPVSRSS
jgi:hypothetical protein